MLRINAGSGQRRFGEGWTNVDINPKWEPDIVADCAHMPMFEDGSADIIVSHHSAEHLTLDGSKALFAECHRILAPGGSLLVFVPNLEELVKAWMQGRINDYIFCVNLHGAWMGDEADLHRWSFTPKTIAEHISCCAQWGKVLPFNWRTIDGADIAKDWWVLGIEAIKE